jgi:hypothetical protein
LGQSPSFEESSAVDQIKVMDRIIDVFDDDSGTSTKSCARQHAG